VPEVSLSLELESLLRFSIAQGISDIHLKPGRPPVFRLSTMNDLVSPKGMGPLEEGDIHRLTDPLLQEHHRLILRERGGVDLGWGIQGVGRFRIHVYRSRVGTQAALRVVPARIPGLQDLGLPPAVSQLTGERRGFILVTGAAGNGKSTTLASMLDQINRTRPCHIVTIEDPIEFVIEDRRGLVTQREVGSDTSSFTEGLRAALRQDPDVILVGEVRDRETVETALRAAETGHLVLSTMHTLDAKETVQRVIGFFEPHEYGMIRRMLASVLKAVICQRLVQRQDGRGRVPAVELMLATARIRDLLLDPDGLSLIADAVAQGQAQYGMQTFDQSLMLLYREGRIRYEEALAHATNPADFALRVQGIAAGEDAAALVSGPGNDPYRF